MMPSPLPHSPTALYWNTRGNVRCEIHVQEIEQTRWGIEGWAPIPKHEDPHRRRYQCQKCSPDGNPIAR
jgi:hypothetical protein